MSFLRRLFGRSAPAPQPSRALAMVLLRSADSFDLGAVRRALDVLPHALPRVEKWETQDGATVASVPGGALALLSLPAPVPRGDLEGPVQLAWHWPGAAARVAEHTAHVIVNVGSTTLDQIDAHLLLTKVVEAILDSSDAVGVYVGQSLLVRSAEDYAQDAAGAARDALPLLSWVGFQLVDEDGQHSAYTTGLGAFGLLELEVRRSALSPAELLGTLADVAHYQLVSGRRIGDGETFGATAHDRTRIRYQRSEFIPDMQVAVVQMS